MVGVWLLLGLTHCGSDSSDAKPSTDAGTSDVNAGGDAVVDGGASSTISVYSTKAVDKIDLLFMIDNSASMGDKQATLAEAVPDLVNRLVAPVCIDASGARVLVNGKEKYYSTADGCGVGNTPEFSPITDIHIGIITSSLGGHGGDMCDATKMGSQYDPAMGDMSHLISRKNGGGTVDTWKDLGFLNWNPKKDSAGAALGTSSPSELTASFTDMVKGVGESGCGFEASLEAWYRFLVDPNPYLEMVAAPCSASDTGNNCRAPSGTDETVLKQRKDFVRPDSLLATIMLTDENDCSIIDHGQAYLTGVTGNWHPPRGTSACDTDPNSTACMSCGQANGTDPNCAPDKALTKYEDASNLRCYRQKQRFGVDWLYPTSRYVEGLTNVKLSDGTYNPVFCSDRSADGHSCNGVIRDVSRVVLAGITGVPWQDLAYDSTDLSKGYYRPAVELGYTKAQFEAKGLKAPAGLPAGKTLWDVVIGDPDKNVEPLDPLMIESVNPRAGTSPLINELLQANGSTTENPVNGTERALKAGTETGGDLQYACRFQLDTPRNCANPSDCDCADTNNPLCRKPSDGTQDDAHQYYAKAYPGRRQLTVLKGLGERAIVASICAAETKDDQSSIYGYRPAIRAIVDRLSSNLRGKCLEQKLTPDAKGQVQCSVIEGRKVSGACNCDASESRSALSSEQQSALAKVPEYSNSGFNCACTIAQVDAAGMSACTTSPSDNGSANGWCYVDPTVTSSSGTASIVAACPADEKRLIRFVGKGAPASNSTTFIQCAAH